MNAPLFERDQRSDFRLDKEGLAAVAEKLADGSIKRMRFAFVDLQGETRCKTLLPAAAQRALKHGLHVAGTTLLKDSSDRTAIPVFEAGGLGTLSRFANASNLLLTPLLETFKMLPWSPGTAWIVCQASHLDGSDCGVDARRILQTQIARLGAAGYQLRCGIELEFHVYKLREASRHCDPDAAGWPGPAPEVDLVHPGYHLLSERNADAAHEVLELIESVAIGLSLPLSSLEIEFGPSQFEAVFEVQDALDAADCVVLFRTAVHQALARRGFLATFMCRPPFQSVMSSGWHMHQSLIDADGRNVLPVQEETSSSATKQLSAIGEQWLAGLMDHALGACLLGTTTSNGYARYQPGRLAPTRIFWGYEDRSALFRVVGEAQSLRIENRLGEPAANPYLYTASQIICGLDGIEQQRVLKSSEHREHASLMPSDLNTAICEFQKNEVVRQQLGLVMSSTLEAAKALEWQRFSAAEDKTEFQKREYLWRL